MRIPCIPVWIKAMLTAVILVLLVKTFAFTSCTIPSTGMENSLYQGERVLVNKWSYGFRVPFSYLAVAGKTAGKGDIVLFNNPIPMLSLDVGGQSGSVYKPCGRSTRRYVDVE